MENRVEARLNTSIAILCEKLDTDLYFPLKEELAEKGITHSLGFKKENFKQVIHNEIQAAIYDIRVTMAEDKK